MKVLEAAKENDTLPTEDRHFKMTEFLSRNSGGQKKSETLFKGLKKITVDP